MIGTISIECNAKNPNMPLHPLRAYINSPSSLRITNVPRKIGKWNINKVTIVAIYPDSTSQTAQCVLTGGVWVGTIEGSTTAGTLAQGYSIIADGVDENGNDVTGYVLGKGDIVIMKADGVPEPEPATIFVKLQDDGTGAEDGDMYPTESGYMIQQNGEAHQLGTSFEQITAYVDSQVSSKAEISSVPTKTSDLSNDVGFITSADIHNDYIEDINGSSISADRSFITVTQLSGVWQLQYGVTTNTLHGQSKTNMSYYPTEPTLGDNAFQLTWGIHSTEYWTLEVYTYNSDWSQTTQYDSEAATSAVTELVFPNTSVQECIYEEPRIVETGKLAAQEWVEEQLPTKTSDLSNDVGFITSADIITKRGLYDMNVYAEDVLSAGYYAVSAYDHATGDFAMSALLKRQAPSIAWWTWQSGISSSFGLQFINPNWHFTYQNIDNGHGTTYTGSIVNVQVVDPLQTAEFSDNQLDFKLNTAASKLVNSMQLSKVEDKIWYDNTSVVNSQNVVYLEDRAVQAVNLTSDSTVMVLPTLVNGKTNDFVLDVCNTNQDSQEEGLSAVFSLSGTIGIDFNIVVPAEESFAEMTTLEAGEIAEYYFTKTAFALSSLPTWKVVKQKVEPYTPTTI